MNQNSKSINPTATRLLDLREKYIQADKLDRQARRSRWAMSSEEQCLSRQEANVLVSQRRSYIRIQMIIQFAKAAEKQFPGQYNYEIDISDQFVKPLFALLTEDKFYELSYLSFNVKRWGNIELSITPVGIDYPHRSWRHVDLTNYGDHSNYDFRFVVGGYGQKVSRGFKKCDELMEEINNRFSADKREEQARERTLNTKARIEKILEAKYKFCPVKINVEAETYRNYKGSCIPTGNYKATLDVSRHDVTEVGHKVATIFLTINSDLNIIVKTICYVSDSRPTLFDF